MSKNVKKLQKNGQNSNYRFRREPGIVQVDAVRLPPAQELGAEDLADDRSRMGQPTQLNIAFRHQFETRSARHKRRQSSSF